MLMLFCPLWVMAQWESGTSKTGSVSKMVHDVWYTISLPEDGEVSLTYERLSNIGGENLTIYAIVDGENVQRDFAWVDGTENTLTCPNLKPGTYKVKMHANPRDDRFSGTYRLSYTFRAPAVKTDPTPNQTWQDCPLLEDGVTLGGHMGYAYAPADIDNTDWFKIEVPKDGKVQFEFRSAPTLTVGFVELCALNAEGTDVNRQNGQWLDYPDSTMVFETSNCQAGTYYLYMPRRGGYGIYHLTYRFIAPATDSDPEPNDEWQAATQLADGVLMNSHLGYAYNTNNDTKDWYSIEVPEDGKLTIITRSSSTLTIGFAELCALNADQSDVQRRNGMWLDYRDSTLVFETPNVSAGTYYLYMPLRGGYGTYTVTSYFTGHSAEADPEPNDDWQAATPLRQGPAVTGQLGYDYNNTKDVKDWYKLNVPEEGRITLTISSEETLTIGFGEIMVPNADATGTNRREGMWLDQPGDTLTFTLNNAAAGDYYLYLPLRGGYGTYSLQYTFTPCAMSNDGPQNDEWKQATEFAAGSTIDARLGYDYSNSFDGKDWFKLDVPEEGRITLTICSEKTLTIGFGEICVPNAEGSAVTRREGMWLDQPGDTLTFTLNNAAAGAYYLYMPQRAGYGGYRMTYTFTPCAMANDASDNHTWDKAAPIEAGTTKEARLGYNYSNSLNNSDWFKLHVPEEGRITLTICSEKTLTIGCAYIYSLKADGSNLTSRNSQWLDYPGDTLTFALNNAAPGDYYLLMPHRAGYGGYRVTYTFTPCAIANDMAGNDTKDTAMPIVNGAITQGRLGYDYSNSLDGQDWYAFTMSADGSASFTICSEKTLTLGCAYIYALNADGTGVVSRETMWLDEPGDTLVFHKDDLAAGTYYLHIPLRAGYGGYTVKSTFTKNAFFQERLNNTNFANRITLEAGVGVSGTLGYGYRGSDQVNESWFDLGSMHGRQIDVEVEVESSHSLSIGVATLYKYKGDREDGSPILEQVKAERLERSSGTISYVDNSAEDSHYVFYLPRYNGYGGYIVTLGADRQANEIDLAGGNINVMTEGRNTVRKGVPCENPITITNTSPTKTGKFLVTVAATDDINILGFRLPGKSGSKYVPIEEATVLDGATCEHTVVFVVPSLDPWESYTFTMISEGKGDIAYAPSYRTIQHGPRKVTVNSNTFTIVAVLGNVEGADKHIFVSDYLVHRIGDLYDLTGEQRLKMSQLLDQLESEKAETGIAAYSVFTLLKRASELCGISLLDATCPIASLLRQRIWWWVYQDEQYETDDNIDILDGKAAITDIVASWDPNEMCGPAGVGAEHYIGQAQTLNYRILFENKAEAGDAAYRIRISDELDPNIFDVSSVRFGETSHDGVGYNWKMTREGNTLKWDIEGIELPPNVNAPEGEGFVSFFVDLKPGLADGTQIKNKAEIIFDRNFPIETNEYVNILDITPPTTTMANVTYDAATQSAQVNCQADDAASGLDSYLLFASKDGSDYAYMGQYYTNSIACPVEPEAVYSFYVLAIDAVGNAEHIRPQVVNISTGITSPRSTSDGSLSATAVFTLDGRYVGKSLSGLKKGVYVIRTSGKDDTGKKIIVK